MVTRWLRTADAHAGLETIGSKNNREMYRSRHLDHRHHLVVAALGRWVQKGPVEDNARPRSTSATLTRSIQPRRPRQLPPPSSLRPGPRLLPRPPLPQILAHPSRYHQRRSSRRRIRSRCCRSRQNRTDGHLLFRDTTRTRGVSGRCWTTSRETHGAYRAVHRWASARTRQEGGGTVLGSHPHEGCRPSCPPPLPSLLPRMDRAGTHRC